MDASIRPVISTVQAKDMVEQLYGLIVREIKELDSYDDRNFFVKVESSHTNPHIQHICCHGYVFKVLNRVDSVTNHVDAEHEVQHLLHQNGIACSLPVINIHGQDQSLETLDFTNDKNDLPQSGQNIVRLLTFVPGTVTDQITLTAELLHSFGDMSGRICTSLKEWNHSGLSTNQILWCYKGVPQLRDYTDAVKEKKLRNMVEEIISAFEENVLAREAMFEKGAIHGDFHEQNAILMHPVDGNKIELGVIDFRDAQYDCLVFDLAITMTYTMNAKSEVSPLEAGGHVIAGYLPHRALNEIEWHILKVCIASRFCQTLVLGAYTHQLDPSNEYVLYTSRSGWKILQMLWQTPNEQLMRGWRDVVSSYGRSSLLPASIAEL